MGIILYLIVGGIIGWVASMLMKRDAQQGVIMNVIVGIVGSLIGGLLFGGDFQSLTLTGILSCLAGAAILLAIVNLFKRGRVR